MSLRKESLSINHSRANSIRIYFGETNENKNINSILLNNKVTCTGFNLITWIPKCVLLQFKKLTNFYYLILSIITFLPFSFHLPGSIIPQFALVLLSSILKDGFEDYNRYKEFLNLNEMKIFKLDEKGWNELMCWQLKPGDIIKFKNDDEIICDILLLFSSNPLNKCYIDTKYLDGECYLKEKICLNQFKKLNNDMIYKEFNGYLDCDGPNLNLKFWEGKVHLKDDIIQVNQKNFLLKGSILKNTDFIIGVIIYANLDTKIMKNFKKNPQKISNLEIKMNRFLFLFMVANIIISIVLCILSFLWYKKYGITYYYIYPSYLNIFYWSKYVFNLVVSFLNNLVTFSQLIPISLNFYLEIIRLIQSIVIKNDNDIFDKKINKPSKCKTLDLIQDLGQIEFLFTDKTGTLTQNKMILKKFYVGDKIYEDFISETKDENLKLNGNLKIVEQLSSKDPINEIKNKSLEDFLYLLALCHIVSAKEVEGIIIYEGPSPDEIALVEGAMLLGFELKSKIGSELTIHNHYSKKDLKYDLILEIPFDSNRKRMSVIVKDKQTKELILLSKGADDVMISSCTYIDQEKIKKITTEFAKEGLRLFIMGRKILDKKKFKIWHKKFKETSHEKNLVSMCNDLEMDLEFVGCSALEDKLQEGVVDSITTLSSCGIKIWVLTGDKLETTEEVAKSCKLINVNMDIFRMNSNNFEHLQKQIEDFLKINKIQIPQNEIQQNLSKILESYDLNKKRDFGILVDGVSLGMIFNDIQIIKKFFCICFLAKSVICCRLSPLQKSNIIIMIKSFGNWLTMSVGDGVNDVPMIMEAHIGVGIESKETSLAVTFSDFSIGQFCFLDKIILIYGINGFYKISKFICYIYYRNIVLVVSQLLFTFSNGFSGQLLFADYLIFFYNTFCISLPSIITFSFHKNVDFKEFKKFPNLFQAGQRYVYLNLWEFIINIINATIHAILIYFIPVLGLNILIDDKGRPPSHWLLSTVSFSIMIQVVMLKLLIINDFWNILNTVSIIISIMLYYVFLLFCSLYFIGIQPQLAGIINEMISNWRIITLLVIVSFFVLLPDVCFKQLYSNVMTNPINLSKRKSETYRETTDFYKYKGKELSIQKKGLELVYSKIDPDNFNKNILENTNENLIKNQNDFLFNLNNRLPVNKLSKISKKTHLFFNNEIHKPNEIMKLKCNYSINNCKLKLNLKESRKNNPNSIMNLSFDEIKEKNYQSCEFKSNQFENEENKTNVFKSNESKQILENNIDSMNKVKFSNITFKEKIFKEEKTFKDEKTFKEEKTIDIQDLNRIPSFKHEIINLAPEKSNGFNNFLTKDFISLSFNPRDAKMLPNDISNNLIQSKIQNDPRKDNNNSLASSGEDSDVSDYLRYKPIKTIEILKKDKLKNNLYF